MTSGGFASWGQQVRRVGKGNGKVVKRRAVWRGVGRLIGFLCGAQLAFTACQTGLGLGDYEFADPEAGMPPADDGAEDGADDSDDQLCNASAASAEACAAVTSACGGRAPGEVFCEGSVLRKCKDDLSGVDDVQTCTDQACNAEAGACTNLACLECDACAEAAQCTTPNPCMSGTCNSNGSCEFSARQPGFSCGDGLVCDALGRCGGCDSAADCSAASDACHLRSCDDNVCGQGNAPERTTCSFGDGVMCNADGECVACLDAADCTASNDCYTATCSAGQCGETPKQPRDTCDRGGDVGVCDGNGECLGCIDGTDCGGQQVCRAQACVIKLQFSVGNTLALAGSATTVLSGLLYAIPVDIPNRVRLLSFGIVAPANVSDSFIRFALYSDQGDAPTDFLIQSTEVQLPVVDASVEAAPLSATTLDAGRYWIAAIYDGNALHYESTSGTLVYGSDDYDATYPNPFSPTATVNDLNYNYYLNLEDSN